MRLSLKCLSMMKCVVLLVTIIGCLVPGRLTVTTTFHDKPDETKLPVMAKLMRHEEEVPSPSVQVTNINTSVDTANTTHLPSSERQKRLLPYMTFYLAHDFNLPSGNTQNQVYQTPEGTRYQLVEAPLQQQKPPATTYQQFHNKFTELTSNLQVQEPQSQQINFTPFLETNALPGPFQPMRQQVPVKVLSKVPNFSQIYDKLALLKSQQQHQQLQTSKGYSRYQPFHYQQQQQQQKINYIPLINYQEVPPTQLDQDKTIIHTYSSTNIDIPIRQPDEQPPPESYHHHHLQQPFVPSAPHQDHVQPVTAEEHKQYLEDTQKYVHQEIRRPQQIPKHLQQPPPSPQSVHVLRQKPIRVIPHKIIYEEGKPTYQQQFSVPQKQLVFVRKPPISVKQQQQQQQQQQPPQQQQQQQQHQQPQVIQFVIPPPKYEAHENVNKYHVPSYEVLNRPGSTSNKINNYGNVRYETVKYASKPQQQQQSYQHVVYPEYQVPKYIQGTTPSPYNPPIVKYQHIAYSTHKPKTHQSVISYDKITSSIPTQSNREYHQHHSHNQQESGQHHDSPTAVGVTTDIPYLPTENSNSLSIILKKLQDTNALPLTLTPDNIDNSIKTLVKILSSLKKQQHFSRPIIVADESPSSSTSTTTTTSGEQEGDNVEDNEAGVGLDGDADVVSQSYPLDTQEGGTPGKPGVDYPALSTIPQTSFNCKMQRYKGFFGDPDTNCQVWHYCDLNGGQASFLCPNGTIFSQVALTCDWWYNVKCSTTAQLYVLNERLYKYILPLSPKFPEDYSGPLVDRYLALKFKEMEDKMKKQRKQNHKEDGQHEDTDDSEDKEAATQTGKPEENETTLNLTNESIEAINAEDQSSKSNIEVVESEQNPDAIEEE